jgi:hypothetical protein
MRLRNALQPSRDGKRGLGFEGKPAPARNCGQIATPNRAGSEFGPIQELKLSIVFMKKANGNVRAMHVRAARRNGLSVEEIKEVFVADRYLLRRTGCQYRVPCRAGGVGRGGYDTRGGRSMTVDDR